MYATVYGLTEEELPVETCPTGILPVPLPGFCYGGQDCSQQTVGHLIFLRNTKNGAEVSTDQLNHEYYRNKVFLPFVENTRKYYLQKEGWNPGDPVEDDYLWAGWQVRICTHLRNNRRTFSAPRSHLRCKCSPSGWAWPRSQSAH